MREIYVSLIKPGFAPAPEVFGVAWAGLYILLAIASVLLIVRAIQARVPGWIVGILFVNVVANLLFTPMFVSFGLLAGLITILVVLTTAVWLQMKTWSSAPLVFALLLPYTVGVSFALVLQASLVLLN